MTLFGPVEKLNIIIPLDQTWRSMAQYIVDSQLHGTFSSSPQTHAQTIIWYMVGEKVPYTQLIS